MMRAVLIALAVLASAPVAAQERSCAAVLGGPAKQFAAELHDAQGRPIPVSVFHPDKPGSYPLVVFSHGAFAAPERYAAMLAPLAGAGLIIIAPTHVDSEVFGTANRPAHAVTWMMRNAEMALALQPDAALDGRLASLGLAADRTRLVAMGHSYGALIAQLLGGATAIEPDGGRVDRRNASVAAVVAWSPPGPLPGLMAKEGWHTLTAPALTITGTADVLPGFIDDWNAHRASFDAAPAGQRMLWVGEGVDHYFGGMFGRLRQADAPAQAMFNRALVTALAFIHRRTGHAAPCDPGAVAEGEQRVAD